MKGPKRRTSMLEYKHLPPELWTEILPRLPAKTLLRFRCVCKTWCSFIDSPEFIYTHHNLYRNKNQFITLERLNSEKYLCTIRLVDHHTVAKIAEFVLYSKLFLVPETVIVGGLILMELESDANNVVQPDSEPRELSLWNPSAQKLWPLPLSPIGAQRHSVKYHLGFAPSCNDYRVVAFVCHATWELSIAVYSLNDHVWEVIANRISVPGWDFETMMYGYGAVYSQGALYWRPSRFRRCSKDDYFLCFEFDTQKLSSVELPEDTEENSTMRYLFLLGGSLAVFYISPVRSCIWVMEKGHVQQPWRQRFLGGSTSDAYKFFDSSVHRFTKVFYIEGTGTLLLSVANKLMSYNIKSHHIQDLRGSHRCLYVDTFVESLVLHRRSEVLCLRPLAHERSNCTEWLGLSFDVCS